MPTCGIEDSGDRNDQTQDDQLWRAKLGEYAMHGVADPEGNGSDERCEEHGSGSGRAIEEEDAPSKATEDAHRNRQVLHGTHNPNDVPHARLDPNEQAAVR